jgi:hypothetical protein
LAQGIPVRVWDLSPIYDGERYRSLREKGQIEEFEGYRACTDEKSALEQLRALTPKDAVLTPYGFPYRMRAVGKALSQSRAHLGQFRLGIIPMYVSDPAAGKLTPRLFARKLRSLLKAPSKGIERVYNKTHRRIWGIRPMDFLLLAGTEARARVPEQGAKTRILWTHSMDVEAARAMPPSPVEGLAPNSYCVFLDEFVPFHPDYPRYNYTYPCTADQYYPLLCRFFDDVEKRTGVTVIIAAHPRSEYDKHPDYFGGRKVIKGATPHLVRHAEFVMAHMSTSISSAVIFKKPMIFIDAVFFQGRFESPTIQAMAALFGKKTITLGQSIHTLDVARELTIDRTAYGAYESKYLKTADTPDKSIWSVLGDYLHTL